MASGWESEPVVALVTLPVVALAALPVVVVLLLVVAPPVVV